MKKLTIFDQNQKFQSFNFFNLFHPACSLNGLENFFLLF